MEFLTTTNLRTQSTYLVDLLKKGTPVSLVHRSRVIGVVRPQPAPDRIIKDGYELAEILASIEPKKNLTAAERKKQYSAHLSKKYG